MSEIYQSPSGAFASKIGESLKSGHASGSSAFGNAAIWMKCAGFFLVLTDQVGLGLGVLGLGGLLIPLHKRNQNFGWVILIGAVGGFLLWLANPSDDLSRFLPGVMLLAVAGACGAWPKPVIYFGAAFSVLTAVNYRFGWAPAMTVPLPFIPVRLFVAGPPSRQNWKIAEILRAAQAQAVPNSFWGLTVATEHSAFGRDGFYWTAKRLGLTGAAVREPGAFLRGLSHFVVLRSGESKASKDQPPWFYKAYEKVSSWTLPDKSEAALYRQKKVFEIPYKKKSIDWVYFSTAGVTAENLKIDFGDWDPAEAAYSDAKLRASSVESKGAKITQVSLDAEKLRIFPTGASAGALWDEFQILRLGSVKVNSLTMEGGDLQRFLEAVIPGLVLTRVTLEGSFAFEGSLHGVAFSIAGTAAVSQPKRRLLLSITKFMLGTTEFPERLWSRWKTFHIPLEATPERPFALRLAGLTLKGGRLSVP